MWLLRFMRVRKYVVADAVKNVCGWIRWCAVQSNLPQDMFEDFGKEAVGAFEGDIWTMKAADFKDILEENVLAMLPGYSTDGNKMLCILRLNAFLEQMKKQPIKKVMLASTYLLDQASLDPNTQVGGLGIIEDLGNVDFGAFKSMMKRKDFQELQKKKASAMNDSCARRCLSA
jgi:hypothetical protein